VIFYIIDDLATTSLRKSPIADHLNAAVGGKEEAVNSFLLKYCEDLLRVNFELDKHVPERHQVSVLTLCFLRLFAV
jgi:hypothetical protein